MEIRVSSPKVHVDRRGIVRRISDGLPFFVADVYSTSVFSCERKGQHWYDTKIMSYVCVKGTVQVTVFDPDKNECDAIYLSDKNYKRITIPPGLWVTLEGIEQGENILVVCASEKYDEDAVHTEPITLGWVE